MINGYQVSQALHVAADLGIADQLGAEPRASDEIAAAVGADPGATYRLMRALAAVGIFEEHAQRKFSHTGLGEYLRSDHPTSIRDWAVWIGQESFWGAWGNLTIGVRTGKNVFPQIYGKNVWEYRSERPELSAKFDRAMQAISRFGMRVLNAYDFSGFAVIADVGGGNGALLTAILEKNPGVRGILFDQPHVVSDGLLKAAGVSDRCEIIGGSFFDAVPSGADAYIMKHIIHDWPDEDSVAILTKCRKAMRDGTRLLLIERIVGPPNTDPQAKFSDLNMLVGPGGLERTEDEYASLLNAAGFRLSKVVPTQPGADCVIEALPA
jgi:hypothetical protein